MSSSPQLNQSGKLRIPVPEIFAPLIKPCTYKGAKGGRGSGKSHFFAEWLVVQCLLGHTRAACLREIQDSIKDSVKQLIEDKIQALGLASRFNITEREIVGPNESLFIFRGLQNHTATSIKSLEGFNRAFVEEAQTISQKSLDLLYPTFRDDGTELYFAWNPTHEKDPVERFFRENEGDPDFICVQANFRDNPWFPDKLRKDMLRDQQRDPDKYAHVWLGKYQRSSEARVFRNWKVEEFDTPKDARYYFGADWGFAVDPTVLVRCWIKDRVLYVDQEAWQVGCEIDRTPALFDKIPGSRQWPIKADSSNPQSISYMARQGFRNITPAVKGPGSVEEGIEFLKGYDIVVHPRCKHVIDELSTYSYEVDRKTDEVLPKLADKKNHTIDSLRYALEGVRRAPPVLAVRNYGI
jgi:phage terminase large subunit